MNSASNWTARVRESVKGSTISYFIPLLLILLALQLFYMMVTLAHGPITTYFNKLGYGLGYSKYKLEFIITTLKYTLISIFQLSLILLGCRLYKFTHSAAGLRIPVSAKKILAAVIIAFAYKFLRESAFGFYYKGAASFSISWGDLWGSLQNPLAYYFLFIVPLFIPFFEEFFYRGFVYKAIEGKAGWKMAVFCSACLFSMFHTEKFISFNFEIFIKGLIYGLLRKWDGTIGSSVAAHSTSNLILSWFTFRI